MKNWLILIGVVVIALPIITLGEDQCKVGDSRSEECGKCGTKTSECLDGGTWGAWGECSAENQEGCLPGAQEEKTRDGIKYQRTCSTECEWEVWLPQIKEYKYKNFRWMMTEQEALKLLPTKDYKRTVVNKFKKFIVYRDIIDHEPIYVKLWFYENQLFYAELIFFDVQDTFVGTYYRLESLLEDKYGPPDNQHEHRDDNPYTELKMEVLIGEASIGAKWKKETTEINIGLFGKEYTATLYISYSFIPLDEKADEKDQEQTRSEL